MLMRSSAQCSFTESNRVNPIMSIIQYRTSNNVAENVPNITAANPAIEANIIFDVEIITNDPIMVAITDARIPINNIPLGVSLSSNIILLLLLLQQTHMSL